MRPEQAGLVRRARSDLALARGTATEETAYASVSRAYYAMFHAARALLLGDGLEYSRHSAVIAAFGQHFAKTGRAPAHLHRYLIDAHAARVDADYDALVRISVTQAHEQIAWAQEFPDFAEQLLGPLPESEPETPQ